MELPLRIRYGLGGIISHSERARLVERRAQPIGPNIRRGNLIPEDLLGYSIDDCVHQIHHLHFLGAAYHAHRGARDHKFVVVRWLKGNGNRVVLKVRLGTDWVIICAILSTTRLLDLAFKHLVFETSRTHGRTSQGLPGSGVG
jgi:hypothetical protein